MSTVSCRSSSGYSLQTLDGCRLCRNIGSKRASSTVRGYRQYRARTSCLALLKVITSTRHQRVCMDLDSGFPPCTLTAKKALGVLNASVDTLICPPIRSPNIHKAASIVRQKPSPAAFGTMIMIFGKRSSL